MRSLSLPKPGLSSGFQAEPGLQITRWYQLHGGERSATAGVGIWGPGDASGEVGRWQWRAVVVWQGHPTDIDVRISDVASLLSNKRERNRGYTHKTKGEYKETNDTHVERRKIHPPRLGYSNLMTEPIGLCLRHILRLVPSRILEKCTQQLASSLAYVTILQHRLSSKSRSKNRPKGVDWRQCQKNAPNPPVLEDPIRKAVGEHFAWEGRDPDMSRFAFKDASKIPQVRVTATDKGAQS